MEDLNPNVRKQLDDILRREGVPLDQMGNVRSSMFLIESGKSTRKDYEALALIYLQSMDRLPMCFWLKILEIAQKITNHITELQLCQKFHAATKTCLAGHPMDECLKGCKDYLGQQIDYASQLECNGDCNSHQPGDNKPEEGKDA